MTDTAELTVICAWCGLHLRGPALELRLGLEQRVSHGICTTCAATVREEIAAATSESALTGFAQTVLADIAGNVQQDEIETGVMS